MPPRTPPPRSAAPRAAERVRRLAERRASERAGGPPGERAGGPPGERAGDDGPLTATVGNNLRQLRLRRRLSLEGLASVSGVSRSMLGQIELGQSAPTINVVWKIARALEVPFSALLAESGRGGTHLLPARSTKRLTSADGSFTSRALFPFDAPRRVEFYELRLAPLGREAADAHAPGTVENLVVGDGALELTVGDARHLLGRGDAIVFAADVPHTYLNPADAESVLYLVMTYAEEVR